MHKKITKKIQRCTEWEMSDIQGDPNFSEIALWKCCIIKPTVFAIHGVTDVKFNFTKFSIFCKYLT